MMSIEADSIKAQVVIEVMQRITALDQAQRYEDSYALTQEFREWLLDPRIQPSSRQAKP
jgi:hypothetical protein